MKKPETRKRPEVGNTHKRKRERERERERERRRVAGNGKV